jgi:hypothetical protein
MAVDSSSGTTVWVSADPASQNYWITSSAPLAPVDCRWHIVQDVWALVDEADGEVLARVQEERGLWLVMVDADPVERYLSESQAKARAEEAAGPVNIVLPKRQNSSGIP